MEDTPGWPTWIQHLVGLRHRGILKGIAQSELCRNWNDYTARFGWPNDAQTRCSDNGYDAGPDGRRAIPLALQPRIKNGSH